MMAREEWPDFAEYDVVKKTGRIDDYL